MLVSVLPAEFDFREHLYLWKKYKARDQLIPWEIARDYFRKPEVYVNAMANPPIIGSTLEVIEL
jgi:hypothetical protein